MQDESLPEIEVRLDEIAARVDQLEKTGGSKKSNKPWYKPSTPTELIAFIGLPAALIAASWGFYDGVWLRLQRLDAATVAVAQDNLTELQDLRSEIFVLNAREKDAESAAILEAKRSRIDRLVGESYAYWKSQPSYFTNNETLLLAEALQLQSRQQDAIEVVSKVQADGPIEKADLERFKGSLYGAESSVQNLETAREHYKQALQHAAGHTSEAGKQQLFAKITYSWLFTELSNRSSCEQVKPVAETLAEIQGNDPDGYNLGILNDEAQKLLKTAGELCA